MTHSDCSRRFLFPLRSSVPIGDLALRSPPAAIAAAIPLGVEAGSRRCGGGSARGVPSPRPAAPRDSRAEATAPAAWLRGRRFPARRLRASRAPRRTGAARHPHRWATRRRARSAEAAAGKDRDRHGRPRPSPTAAASQPRSVRSGGPVRGRRERFGRGARSGSVARLSARPATRLGRGAVGGRPAVSPGAGRSRCHARPGLRRGYGVPQSRIAPHARDSP